MTFHNAFHNKMALMVIWLLCLAAFPANGLAEDFDLGGFIAIEGRFFIEDSAFDAQSDDPPLSLVAEPEIRYRSAAGNHQFKLTPFARLDSVDDERSHFDLREAYWRYTLGDYRLLVGLNKVFWGVTESRHLVDIINQSDNLEDIDLEDKLGQPMVLIGTERDWGDIELFIMPYFREREFPGEDGRLRPGLLVTGDPLYESGAEENHIDLALRYSGFVGDWDIGASYFYGTGREPLLLPDATGQSLTAFYGIIHQFGVDIQYTKEAWLWKFEGILQNGLDSYFGAVVGGFEYTLYQIFDTNADLGLLLEYNWDDRDQSEEPATFFDNDIFIGSRLALNDPQDSTALIGAIIDTDNGSTILSLEAERRVGESWVVELIGRFFLNIDETDITASLKEDSFMNLSIQYHF